MFETTELVPRAFEEKDETISTPTTTTTTEKGEEEMTTTSTKISTKSSHHKESESDESRETREFSEMNTSESPMFVTEKSTLYPIKGSHYDRMITTVQPRLEMETEQVSVVPSKSEMKMTEEQIPRKSSTTMKMISTSTLSHSSSKVPQKYLGRLEDQSEPSEDVETTTKSSRRVTKKPMKHHEEEEEHQQPAKELEQEHQQPATEHEQTHQQSPKELKEEHQQPAKELEQEVPVTEETEVKGDYKVAEYDPKALDSVSTLETVRMQYDENNESVSYAPLVLATMQSSHEANHPEQRKLVQNEKSLDQAQESSVVEEEKSNH